MSAERRDAGHVTHTKVRCLTIERPTFPNPFAGHKSSVYTHLNYLIIVSPPFIPTASAASATVRNFVARSANPGETDITKVTVFEPENKYVAYSGTFTHDVREVISQWGQIYVLTSDGKVCCPFPRRSCTNVSCLAVVPTGEIDLGEAGYAVSKIAIHSGVEPGEDAEFG